MSGSHGGEGDVRRAAAVRGGLYISPEKRRGRWAASLTRHPLQDSNVVAELCSFYSLLCSLCQGWRPLTSLFLFCILLFCPMILFRRCGVISQNLELWVTPLLCEQVETVQTVPEESRAQGNIGLKLYAQYLRSGANVFVLLVVLLMNIVAQVCGESQLGGGR